jgi:predicted glutamine amidotransferase
MCGITGFIGHSKNPNLSHQLITRLFEKSERRGVDASGYWATEIGKDGRVFYHKEPVRSSQFVKSAPWELVGDQELDLLLVHARGASKGVGEPSNNINNHPFTSFDRSIALIHNGRVDDCEYKALLKKYKVTSECDSEILLRIFEAAENCSLDALGGVEMPHRIAGIRDIFSFINSGHMAVAIGERRTDGSRVMWIFRNKHRPLWVVDMREELGQVFFVSEPSIWESAVAICDHRLRFSHKLIELPTEEIWQFKTTEDWPEVKKYVVGKELVRKWEFDGEQCEPIRREPTFEVVTDLDEQDRVFASSCNDLQDFPLDQVRKSCHEAKSLLTEILSTLEDQVDHDVISLQEFSHYVRRLARKVSELNGLKNQLSQ